MPDLSEREMIWLFNYARDGVREAIERVEAKLATQMVLQEKLEYTKEREAKIAELKTFLSSYQKVLQAAQACRDAAMDNSVRVFAKEFFAAKKK